MKIAVVHNRYAADSGEETVVENLLALLEAQGHVVALFTRSISEINRMFLGRARAFLSGIFSIEAKSAFSTFLRKTHPEVVHVHNVFPLISPSILIACRKMGVPVVMSVHNYRLLCPTGLLMPKKEPRICERCCGGHEYWCVLKEVFPRASVMPSGTTSPGRQDSTVRTCPCTRASRIFRDVA